MEPMLADFAQVAQSIAYTPPKLVLISNLTGKQVTEKDKEAIELRG